MSLVRMVDINKSFPGVHALKNISLVFEPGEIHAIIGENGAGKSTLIKILCGNYTHDSGEIYIGEEKVNFSSPRQAMTAGISAVYQELILVPYLSAIDNLFLGSEYSKLGIISKAKQKSVGKEILDSIGGQLIKLDQKVAFLSTAHKQLICIAKALIHDTKVLILDEVTSTLTDVEIQHLFNLLRKLKEDGICIIYISHIMPEIIEIADCITVMKDGEIVSSRLVKKEYTIDKLVNLMIGRELKDYYPERIEINREQCAFEVRNLKSKKLKNSINLKVYKGEVLGVAGLVGSGRTETAFAVFGLDRKTDGSIFLNGQEIKVNSPQDAIKNGISYLPEERKEQGLFLENSIFKNITISSINKILNKIGFINSKIERLESNILVDKIRIKCGNIKSKVNSLSGGNQQKVLVARCIFSNSQVIIFDEPTRGIDVGAKVEIYNLIRDFAKEGKAIIIISSDIMELLGISDRIIVMRNQEVAADIRIEDASEEKLMKIAIGTH